MDRAYLLIVGVLTGAAAGLLSGNLSCWLAAGAVMGLVLMIAARPRRKHPEPQ
jgi:hypothetical protein